VGLSLLAVSAHAAVAGEVIVASDRTTGQRAEMAAASGAGLADVACGGDLLRFGQARYFVHAQAAAGGSTQLYAYSEDCGSGVQLTSDPSLQPVEARWSPNGAHLAFGGTRVDPVTGQVTERGIFVGDVTLDPNGAPAGLANVRLAVSLSDQNVIPSWASDSCRIAFDFPVTSTAGTQYDLFVASVCGPLPAAAADVTNTSDTSEFDPAFSPAANEIAFVKKTSKGGPYRNDVFVLNLTTGSTRQVTNKTNANLAQIGQPFWSPDGRNIAFHAVTNSATGKYDVYRIPSDGSQKALNLTASSPNSYLAPIWRA
jgi:Tol biopolymer transport system component